jgi:hypothetical protein
VDSAGVGENHSVFARAFIDVLQDNDGALRIQELFSRVVLKLDSRQRELGLSQVPQLRPIRAADHVSPNFILIAGSKAGESVGHTTTPALPVLVLSTFGDPLLQQSRRAP